MRFSFALPDASTSAALFESAPSHGLKLVAADGKLLLEVPHRDLFHARDLLVAGPFPVSAGEEHSASIFYDADSFVLMLDGKILVSTGYKYFDIRLAVPAFGLTQSGTPPVLRNVEVQYSAQKRAGRTRTQSYAAMAVFVLCMLSVVTILWRRRRRNG